MKASIWKYLSLFFILIFVVSAVHNVRAADVAPSIAWSQTYQDVGVVAHSVIQTRDGGFLLLCSDWSPPTVQSSIFYLVKVDSSGNQQWNRTYSGTIFNVDSAQYVVETADGGYAAVAEYQNKLLLLKTNQTGETEWMQIYTGAGTCAACAIIQSNDEGFTLVSVSNYDPLNGNDDTIWLVKTNSHGDLQWNQTLGRGDPISLVQTTDDGYAIAGQTGNVNSNFMLLKVDSNGTLQWNRIYPHQDENQVVSVVQTNDGGYALGGWIWLRTNGGGPNIAIVKTDVSGNEQWKKYYGEGPAWAMTKTIDGGFAIAGFRLVKVDGAGADQWEIGLAEQPSCVIQTQGGGYAVAGQASINGTTFLPWLTKISTGNETNPSTSPSQTPTSATGNNPILSAEVIYFATILVGVAIIAVVVFVIKRKKR